jgi:hypothetical protein
MDESKRQQLLQAAAGLLSSSSDDDDASEDPHALIESESDGERRRRRRRREERRHDDEPRRRREDRSRRRSRRSRSRERERHKRRRRSSRRRSPSPSPPAAAPAAAPAPAAPAPPPRRRRRPRRTQEETELWVLAQTREWSARVRSERPGDERAWLGYAEWQEAAAAALLAAQQQQKRQRKGRPRRTVAAAVASTAAAVADKRLSVLAAGLERCPWSGRLLLASLGAYADAGGGGDEEEEAQGGGTTNSVLARWEQALSRRAVEAQAQDGFGPHLARPGADGTALRREWRRWAAEEADSPSPSSPEPSPCDDPHVSSAWPLWRAYLAQRHRSTSFSPASSRALHGRAIAALAAERRSRERDARRHRHRQIQQQQPASQSSPSSAAAAATRAAERLDEQLAQLVLCLARDELDAGCGEAALLRLQGAIEFCFLRPPSAAAAGAGFSEAALADFGEYWRSGAPRVGEAGGSGGWAAWRRHRQQQQRAAEAEVGAPVAPPPVAPASDAPAQEEDEQREEEEEPEAPVAGGTGGWTGWWPARALDETLSPPPPPPEEDDEGAAAPAPPPPPPPPPDQDEDDDDEEMELVVEMGVKIEEALEEARRSGLSSTHALALAKRERQADAKALLPPRSAADNAKEDDNDEDERAALQPTAADDAPCSLDLLLPTLRASPRTAAGARRLLLGALELLGLGPELAAAAPCEAGVVAAADEQGSSWAPSNAPAPACARVGDGTPRPWYLLPRREGDDDDTKNDPEAAAEDARWLFLVRLLSALCASPSAGSPCADSLAWPELGFALVHLHFRRPSLLRRQGPAAAAEAGRAAARALLSGRRDDHLLFAAFASAEARAAAAAAAAAEKQAASAAAPDPALVSKTARRALEQTLAAVCGRGSVGVAAAVALQHSRVLLGGDRPAAAAALTCALANLPYDPRAAAAAAKEGRAYPDEGGDAGAGAASRALDACLERAAQRGGQLAGSEDEAVIAASAALAELTSPEGPAAACAVFERAAAAAAPRARDGSASPSGTLGRPGAAAVAVTRRRSRSRSCSSTRATRGCGGCCCCRRERGSGEKPSWPPRPDGCRGAPTSGCCACRDCPAATKRSG